MFKPTGFRFKWSILFVLGVLLCWVGHISSDRLGLGAAVAQSPPETISAAGTVQQGIAAYQTGNFLEAIALWRQALPNVSADEDRAVVYANLALAYRQTGQMSEAIAAWEEALDLHRARDEQAPEIPKLLTEQAQAYSDLGQHNRAIALADSALAILRDRPDPLTEAALHGILGNAYSALGKYERALAAHEKSLAIAQEAENPRYIATAFNNLGNVRWKEAERLHYQAELAEEEGDRQAQTLKQAEQDNRTRAQQLFEQSIEIARQGAPLEEIRALLNYNHLLENSLHNDSPQTPQLIVQHWQRIEELLKHLPNAREKAYVLINLAESFLRNPETATRQAALPKLEEALAIARKIGDRKAESFALGSLGNLYEQNRKDLAQAMEYTRQAQFAAQQINAADSLYRWQWQAGRIFKAQGQRPEAISSYKAAIASLQSIRGDIIAANKDVQFDFRDRVEPVYRELIELLLEAVPAAATVGPPPEIATDRAKGSPPPTSVAKSPTQSTAELNEVVQTLESLKLAEIQNFFGDECVQVALSRSQGSRSLQETNTAAIYSVILNGETYTILKAPDGTTKHYQVAIAKEEVETAIDELRYFLEDRTSGRYLPYAQKVYDWLIRPMEADLAASGPTTLLFINDGVLRKVPMAALHDGEQYLIQKYPIAISPSVNLTISRPLDRSNLSVLSVGLTIARPPFAALKNVRAEVNAVQEILGGNQLLDGEFTRDNFEAQLQQQNFTIIHMATHGKFGVDAENTFLLAYDEPIAIEELDNLLRSRHNGQPVGLLAMSACQTAAGDNRSALGIAGVAVRAGVETALATLWFINDEATVPLIQGFYTQLLDPQITKAEALRQAQIQMIEDRNYSHPAVWSPFILIGNWL